MTIFAEQDEVFVPLNGPIGLSQLEVAHSRLDQEPLPNIAGAVGSLSGKVGLKDQPLDLLDRVREHWLRLLQEAAGSTEARRAEIVAQVRDDLERWLNYYDAVSGGALDLQKISRPQERV